MRYSVAVPGFARHAVCSPLTLASAVGVGMLRTGGNAVDAAIATNLALAVAYPHMCGLGGDLLALVCQDGQLAGVQAIGALPARAALPPDGVPLHGIASATVPGAPAGWRALAERFGTRPLAELAAPAVRLAADGVERSPGLARMTELCRDLLAQDAEAARIFLAGDRLVQPELARTLADLDGFYAGPVAAAAPAPFTPQDFAAQTVEWVDPLRAPLAGGEACAMPPPSRGHLVLDAIRRLEPPGGHAPDDPAFHLRLVRALSAATFGGDTIYLCVVDQHGTAVSLSQSLYMAFGSGVVVPGTGVLLHDRGAYHTPATYRGGAKPVHTLSPAMVLRNGRPWLVLGTMGGDAQPQIVLQLLARILLAGEDPQHAVAAPRWCFDRSVLLAEEGVPPLDHLPAGITTTPMPVPDLAGHAHAILLEADGLHAACDPRADGVALGD